MYVICCCFPSIYVNIIFVFYNFQEPFLFAVVKLLETGLVNLAGVDVLWRPVTAHLSIRGKQCSWVNGPVVFPKHLKCKAWQQLL